MESQTPRVSSEAPGDTLEASWKLPGGSGSWQLPGALPPSLAPSISPPSRNSPVTGPVRCLVNKSKGSGIEIKPADLFTKHLQGANAFDFSPTYRAQPHLGGIYSPLPL